MSENFKEADVLNRPNAIVACFDRKSGQYNALRVVANAKADGVAFVRALVAMRSDNVDPSNTLAMFPEDFELHLLGFLTESGIEPMPSSMVVAYGSDCLKG